MEYLFFELLQVALGIREGLSRRLTDEEWRKVYEEATRQSLTGVLFCAVERMPKDWRPETDLMMEWYGWTAQIEEMNRLMNREAARLTRLFEQEGHRTAILKGQANARLYKRNTDSTDYTDNKGHTESAESTENVRNTDSTENTDNIRNTDNTDSTEKVLKHLGLEKMAGALMWVLGEVMMLDERLMICKPDARRGEWLLQDMMAGGNFGHYANASDGLWRRFFKARLRQLKMIRFNFWEGIWAEIFFWKDFVKRIPLRMKYRTWSLNQYHLSPTHPPLSCP